MANLFLLAQDDPGRGDDPSGGIGVVVIVAIILVVVLAGVLLARKFFVRGTMPAKPSEDEPGESATAPAEAHTQRRRAQE
jgi:hypothetical protein